MSQRSKHTKSLSQPSRSTQLEVSEYPATEDDYAESGSATQSSQAGSSIGRRVYEAMGPQLREKKISEVVRYLLCAEGRRIPVKRKELTDKVLGEHARAFPIMLEQANEKLSQVFGLEAREITKGKVKSIILINTLPSEARELGLIQWSDHDLSCYGLLSVILSLIMMKQGNITEDQLWNCLERLGLSQGAGVKNNSVFGDVAKRINKEFVEQMYLDRERKVTGDSYTVSYRWGSRAVEEVDKNKLLHFVADMYGGNASDWEKHFGGFLGGSV